jgi:hypothetical protein
MKGYKDNSNLPNDNNLKIYTASTVEIGLEQAPFVFSF